MRSSSRAVSLLFLCSLRGAVDKTLTVLVSNELAPPGATTQIKLSLARPQPLTSGVVLVDLDPAFFGDAIAASAFSAAGDIYGYVVLARRHDEGHFPSNSGSHWLVNGL